MPVLTFSDEVCIVSISMIHKDLTGCRLWQVEYIWVSGHFLGPIIHSDMVAEQALDTAIYIVLSCAYSSHLDGAVLGLNFLLTSRLVILGCFLSCMSIPVTTTHVY